ncbi:hypothetical protein EPA93_41275 [Ktedonosporobacter rubrisoli]|uniref:Uncharacterized protein n=1 Tax=Ktedonosporobacter rubrisoli TaxID=2509675 RepID=A0A4P6K2X1_KTERU|nr:hypothetical protein [Ktedonosporobacter rubrisoli]QBD82070.1 hypothetical protein EPA93_41275 [Ktedonosporobacter rubrisoli]
MEANTSSTAAQSSVADEHRESFGTAKTENLQDSGLWRILLPAFIIIASLALIAIPLIILVWLLSFTLNPHSPMGPLQLTWLWIVMIIIALFIAGILIRGMFKIFMSQAGNYS